MKDEELGRPLLRGTVKDGLYLLAQAHPPEVNIGERKGLDLWHHRLGHPNMRILKSVISTYGLPTLSVNKILSCAACLTSKSYRLPYSKSTHQTTKNHSKLSTRTYGDHYMLSHILEIGTMSSSSMTSLNTHGYIH